HAWRTVLDNGNDGSFLKIGLCAPTPTISILVTVLSVVPALSAGYRASDLVLWPSTECRERPLSRRYWGNSGSVPETINTTRMTRSRHGWLDSPNFDLRMDELRFDIRSSDHLAPFLVFNRDEFPEPPSGGRAFFGP